MELEGMVHALEIVHDLLKPGGVLVDIHPNGDPPPIEVNVGGDVMLAGYLDETDDFEEYFKADEALAEVTARGLFLLEREGLFTFMTHASTITELVDFLKAEWTDSVVHEETIERAKKLMGELGGGKEVVLRESVRIARFRKRSK
jgi:2-polyprenyl-3-methyl-5-hydroxy-6-metoxy-1,4-benzoquinol methylase